MPICGFNQKMINGLDGFQTGLVEHGIIKRSKLKGKTHEEIFKRELDDMIRFQKEMHRIEDSELRALTKALTDYARAFYKLVYKNGIKNYQDTIKFLNRFFWEMETCKCRLWWFYFMQ